MSAQHKLFDCRRTLGSGPKLLFSVFSEIPKTFPGNGSTRASTGGLFFLLFAVGGQTFSRRRKLSDTATIVSHRGTIATIYNKVVSESLRLLAQFHISSDRVSVMCPSMGLCCVCEVQRGEM
jgi:hypothetical protein